MRVPEVLLTETLATVRTALFPLARIRRMPQPPVSDRRPVVLVHGFMGHPDMFRPLTRRLYAAGFGSVERVRYPSTRVRLEDIAGIIDEVVSPLARDGKVDLVGHSLGAVASRAYLKVFGGASKVRKFVSLGGPHAGTALYRLTPPPLWDVLNPEGKWVKQLDDGHEPVETHVIRARYDHQVLPPVRASLRGVGSEVVLDGYGHNGLLWARQAHDAVIAALV